MKILDFVQQRKLNYTPVNITLNNKGKKNDVWQHKGIQNMTFEECKKKSESIKQSNQIWITLNKLDDIIIFDSDEKECYDILKDFLEENKIYNSDFITQSFTGRTKNIKYKRHFWFKINSEDFKNIKKKQYKLRDILLNEPIGDLFINAGVIGEFYDIEMNFNNMPQLSKEDFDKLVILLNIPVNFIDQEEKPKIKKTIKESSKTLNESVEIEELDKESEFIVNLLNILHPKYYENHNDWKRIMMILRKHELNTKKSMFDIFCNFSLKSPKFDKDYIKKHWDYLATYDLNINFGSLVNYAKESNLNEAKEILRSYHRKSNIDITEKYLAEKIKEMAGNMFFFKNKILYCFDQKQKFWYEGQPELLKRYINDDLYDFVSHFIMDAIDNREYLDKQNKILRQKCLTDKGQIEIVKQFTNRFFNEIIEDVEFDQKHYLLGFNNGVFDLQKNEFREYEYDDYMTTRTGYNYQKANEKELKKVNDIINLIEQKEDRKKLLMQVLATGIIGKSYHKFVLFSGCGGNGKSVISSFMKTALGNYFYKGDTKTLCKEANEASPAVANMNKKRYVVFTEPKTSQKIQNSVMKQWTGDKTINSRLLFSNKTEIQMVCTMVLECNKKIYLEEEATQGETRRLIDYPYESAFTENDNEVDEVNRIYKADKSIDCEEFYNKHRNAFIEILISYAHDFLTKDKEDFKIPNEIKNRNEEYINKSYCLLNFLNECTENTKDKDDVISLKDLYDKIKLTDLYLNSTKEQKRKINMKHMKDFYQSNKTTVLSFKEKVQKKGEQIYNVLIGYKFID